MSYFGNLRTVFGELPLKCVHLCLFSFPMGLFTCVSRVIFVVSVMWLVFLLNVFCKHKSFEVMGSQETPDSYWCQSHFFFLCLLHNAALVCMSFFLYCFNIQLIQHSLLSLLMSCHSCIFILNFCCGHAYEADSSCGKWSHKLLYFIFNP